MRGDADAWTLFDFCPPLLLFVWPPARNACEQARIPRNKRPEISQDLKKIPRVRINAMHPAQSIGHSRHPWCYLRNVPRLPLRLGHGLEDRRRTVVIVKPKTDDAVDIVEVARVAEGYHPEPRLCPDPADSHKVLAVVPRQLGVVQEVELHLVPLPHFFEGG